MSRAVAAGPSGKSPAAADKAGPVKTEESIGGSNGSVNGDSAPSDHQSPPEPKVITPVVQPAVVDTHVPIQQPSQQVSLNFCFVF